MAKKAAAKKKTATKAAPVKKAAPKAPKKKSAAPAPALSDGPIGETAGLVWKALLEMGPQTAAALKKAVDSPGDTVMASVGWLAREGKLEFDTSGRTVKIALR